MSEQRIVIASQNPVKIQATRDGFTRTWPDASFTFEGISVPSGVGDQPMTSAETLQGAHNRAQRARAALPGADYYAGIEGGVEDTPQGLSVFAWIVVTDGTRTGQAQTGTFFLPDEVAKLVRDGVELGHADDIVFKRQNSKQGNGAIGLLTGDIIDRRTYYEHAVILALVPFLNPAFDFSGGDH